MSRFEKQREPGRSLKTWIGGFRVPGLVAQHNAKSMKPPATFRKSETRSLTMPSRSFYRPNVHQSPSLSDETVQATTGFRS